MKSAKSGLYFQASMETITTIAECSRDYFLAAGYLALARHCTGDQIGQHEPFRFTSAGQNCIRKYLHISEANAAGVYDRLKECKLVLPAPGDAQRLAPRSARHEVVRGPLSLRLPHHFTDDLRNAESILRRIKKMEVRQNYKEALSDMESADAKLDALMLMLHVYLNTSMVEWGGVAPSCFFRRWKVHSRREDNGGFKWMAEPESPLMHPEM